MAQHTTVIKDVAVVTVDRDDTIHYDAAVAIQDGRIAAVGASRILATIPVLAIVAPIAPARSRGLSDA